MPLHRCPHTECIRVFKRNGDLTRHLNLGHPAHLISASHHTVPPQPLWNEPEREGDLDHRMPSPLGTAPQARRVLHPHLTGDICDEDGNRLPPDTPPSPPPNDSPWSPFENEAEFRLADHLFRKVEMSQNDINTLLDIWKLYQYQHSQHQACDCCSTAPYFNNSDMYTKIDSIVDGNAPWKCFQTTVDEELPENAPEWQKTSYQVWYRDPDTVIANILGNTDFGNDFEAAPYIDVDKNGTRRWSNVMSGNFAWRHADQIYDECQDNRVAGATLVPIILGADKTTVSVATGHVEYHPLYLTIGNITNEARRGHRNAVIPIGFLAIPKSDRKHDKDNNFRVFKKKLYHQSIRAILISLKPAMTQPVVRRCPDGHFRRIIYELAAFIADYPEQVLLAGIVQGWCGRCDAPFHELDTGASTRRTRELDTILLEEYGGEGRTLWDNFGIDDDVMPFTAYFPRADIHEMLSADLLHQVIKGCFKDMLIDWVFEYLVISKGKSQANIIMDDIDHQLAVVPAFPGLRRFPHGRRFKQWTGDDSKALMKIFLPAVAEYLPQDMLKCLSSFLDFCYLVRRSDIDETSLKAIKTSIESFHHCCNIFQTYGVREHFSLPRMHSIVHYPQLITDFGVPNGLCSSITESRHITAVKKPWRRSNRYNALSQMLLTNQRIDKLSALRAKLVHLHLLAPLPALSNLASTRVDEDFGPIDSGRAIAKVELARTREKAYPRSLQALSAYTNNHRLEELTRRFLYTKLHAQESSDQESDVELDDCPHITSKINVYHSAVAIFYAPSDISGVRGMKHERIRSSPSFYGVERRDCILATINEKKAGFRGLSAARVLLFFSFRHAGTTYPCALVHWYNTYGRHPDPNTGLWIVKPGYLDQRKREPFLAVLHLDTFVRAVLLLPVYGPHPIPHKLKYHDSLNLFTAFYVNKYADHHANEILF